MAHLLLTVEGKDLEFKLDLFPKGEEVDLNRLLRVDYNNLAAEKITFPTVLNRLAIILADAEDALKAKELNYRIWKSKEKERLRNLWTNDPNREVVRGAKYTNDQVEDAIVTSKLFKEKKKRLNELTKRKEYASAIYWQAKEKLDRINAIRYEFDIDEVKEIKIFNNVKIHLK